MVMLIDVAEVEVIFPVDDGFFGVEKSSRRFALINIKF